MPRKAAESSLADENSAPGGVAAVDRAMSLLAAFHRGDRALTLAVLAERTRLYKSTVLRLLSSLEHARLVVRQESGTYALGPEVARLHAVFTGSFSLEGEVMPVLRQLVEQTQESAAFHVRQADERLCLYRVDSPHLVRDHTKAGDLLPLDRGAGGRVLCAFSGAKGSVYDGIRKQGYAMLDGDRVKDLTGISAPVFGADGQLVGAVTLTMPTSRRRPSFLHAVRKAAARLSEGLGGAPGGNRTHI
ncbi:IclR family transcriptional regulator [Ramlibacter sp. MMS24-I3-19]|uniref:IclR family transcriptional regulator n=1 Tax=Ramlibacter sp. MMS24-I3-19 TaxID=3416606 RepID=UPI003D0480A1